MTEEERIPVPDGTIIRYRYRGRQEYGHVEPYPPQKYHPNGGRAIAYRDKPPKGTKVVCGVWKGEAFQPRKTITIR